MKNRRWEVLGDFQGHAVLFSWLNNSALIKQSFLGLSQVHRDGHFRECSLGSQHISAQMQTLPPHPSCRNQAVCRWFHRAYLLQLFLDTLAVVFRGQTFLLVLRLCLGLGLLILPRGSFLLTHFHCQLVQPVCPFLFCSVCAGLWVLSLIADVSLW